jgi:hypothetical protein
MTKRSLSKKEMKSNSYFRKEIVENTISPWENNFVISDLPRSQRVPEEKIAWELLPAESVL